MYFDNLQEFLSMGGHGLYVWLSYGLTWLVILVTIVAPLYQQKRFFAQQTQLQRRLSAHTYSKADSNSDNQLD